MPHLPPSTSLTLPIEMQSSPRNRKSKVKARRLRAKPPIAKKVSHGRRRMKLSTTERKPSHGPNELLKLANATSDLGGVKAVVRPRSKLIDVDRAVLSQKELNSQNPLERESFSQSPTKLLSP